MTLRLIVADTRADLLDVWRDVFGGVPTVTVENLGIRELRSAPNVDAILVPSWFAHERYGGELKPGVSQVLRNVRDPEGPRLIVTTPGRSIHFEAIDQDSAVLVPDEPLADDEETYDGFRRVLDAIEGFNASTDSEKISTLGVHLTLINAPQGDARREAEALRAAYLRSGGPD